MGGTSDVTVEEAKASLLAEADLNEGQVSKMMEEAEPVTVVGPPSLLSEPQRMTLNEVIDLLEDMDMDASTRPYGPILITDEDGNETMAALVPIELAQGVGWCAPSP